MKKTSLLPGKAILAASICVLSIHTYAQENKHLGEPIANQSIFNSRDGETVDYFTATRKNYNDVSGMKGNPFLIGEWVEGVVVFKGNKLYNCKDLQFNWIKNELHTRYNGQAYAFDDSVIEFVLLDTSNNKATEVLFRNGYPNMGTHTRISFYQVVAGGANFELLKYWSRHDHEMYEGTGTYTKEFMKVEDWYLYDMKNNKLLYLNLKPASVEKALPEYTTTVKQVTHSIDGKRLTETDLVSLVNNLNKL